MNSSLKMLVGGLVVLASILYVNVRFAQDVPATQARCPEDAVRLVTANDREGACIAADDFAAGTELRNAADGMTAHCQPVGTGVVEVTRRDVVGWCDTTDRRAK